MKIAFYAQVGQCSKLEDLLKIDLTDEDFDVSPAVEFIEKNEDSYIILKTQWSQYEYTISKEKNGKNQFYVEYVGPYNGFLAQNLLYDFTDVNITYVESAYYSSYSDDLTSNTKFMTLEEFHKVLKMARKYNIEIVNAYLDSIESKTLKKLAKANISFLVEEGEVVLENGNWFRLIKKKDYLSSVKNFDESRIHPNAIVRWDSKNEMAAHAAYDTFFRDIKSSEVEIIY